MQGNPHYLDRSALKHGDVVWKSKGLGVAFLIVFTVVLIYYLFDTPSPGLGVALLAVAAAIMSVRPEMKGIEKSFWVLLLFGLLYVENRAIAKERSDSETKHAAELKKQEDNFGAVLVQNQTEFTATTDRMRRLMDTSQKNLDGMNMTLSLMTGGDSRPKWFIQVPNRENPSVDMQFFLTMDGAYPLRSLDVALGQATCMIDPSTGVGEPAGLMTYRNTFDVFTKPGVASDIRKSVALHELKNGRAVFWGQASALNGYWEYLMKFRYESGRWEWRSVIYNRRNSRSEIHIFSDAHSNGFPRAQLQRPLLPLIRDDCPAQ